MMYKTILSTHFASTYGSGTYNTSDYNGSTASTGTTAGTSNGNGSASPLANTGFDILLAVSFACLIIFVALLVRFWRRPARQQALATVPVDNSGDKLA